MGEEGDLWRFMSFKKINGDLHGPSERTRICRRSVDKRNH